MAKNFTYYLLLGGNENNTLQLFDKAILFLSKEGNVVKKSSIHQSEAWGFKSEKLFYNQALEYKTDLPPENLLKKIHEIEISLGRIRDNSGYKDRGIDIDILLLSNESFSSENLQIPHPLLHQRAFALKPLIEICPNYVHPILQKTIAELLLAHNC
ncbi:MAG: 2-amino-4-hydroxy-6-hydroxymethyldihydropteridine diphosphokinase [Bacteroidia bacterium]